MNKFIITLTLLFNIVVLNAQFNFVKYEYESDTLCELNIINENIFTILDAVIEFEQRCTNYDTNIVFRIHIDTNILSNETGINIKYYILIGSYDRILKNDINIGIFEYRGIQFIVSSLVNQSIFEITDKKIGFMFYIPWKKAYYNPETGLPIINYIRERTNWFYWYNGSEFTFHKFGNECGYRK